MTEQPIRIGIVGAGANTRARHIPGLRRQPGVTITAVCNRSAESTRRVAAEFDIDRACGHWREVVTAPEVDAVVIGTWPSMHCEVTLAALAAGKHVLCEARMAMNAAQAHEMLGAAQSNPELVAQVVPSPMTLAVDETIKSLLDDGYLGALYAIEVRDLQGPAATDEPLHWRQDVNLSGLNVMTLGIWFEAIMRWVGPATAVTAMGKTFITHRTDVSGLRAKVHVPDHLGVCAEMACGAQAHLLISGVAGAVDGPPEVRLYGSAGALRFCEGKLYGVQGAGQSWREIAIPEDKRGGWRVEEEFINAIRGREPVKLTTFADGVLYMEFTEAVARSLAEGRAVSLPL